MPRKISKGRIQSRRGGRGSLVIRGDLRGHFSRTGKVKKRYDDAEQAAAAVVRSPDQIAYRCPSDACSGWHLGHPSAAGSAVPTHPNPKIEEKPDV